MTRLSARRADAVIATAKLVKAPSHRTDNRWRVQAEDGTVLVVVTPSYGGMSRSGRNGWRYHLATLGPSGAGTRYPTREAATVAGLGAWKRWATGRP